MAIMPMHQAMSRSKVSTSSVPSETDQVGQETNPLRTPMMTIMSWTPLILLMLMETLRLSPMVPMELSMRLCLRIPQTQRCQTMMASTFSSMVMMRTRCTTALSLLELTQTRLGCLVPPSWVVTPVLENLQILTTRFLTKSFSEQSPNFPQLLIHPQHLLRPLAEGRSLRRQMRGGGTLISRASTQWI